MQARVRVQLWDVQTSDPQAFIFIINLLCRIINGDTIQRQGSELYFAQSLGTRQARSSRTSKDTWVLPPKSWVHVISLCAGTLKSPSEGTCAKSALSDTISNHLRRNVHLPILKRRTGMPTPPCGCSSHSS